MKIRDIRALALGYQKDFPRIPRSFALVRVETDDGIVGYGEACSSYAHSYPLVVKEIVEGILKQRLIGEDPFQTEFLTRKMRKYLWGYLGPSGISNQVIGALEIALWDIKGKALGAPVCQLLGGARDKVKVYGTGTTYFEKGPEWHAEFLRPAVEHGFAGVKVRVGNNPQWDLALVRAAREFIGDDRLLMVDAFMSYTPMTAVRMAELFEPYHIFFYEEPVPQSSLEWLRYVRERVRIPIAVGERTYSLREFQQVIACEAADYLQPDPAVCGGLLECVKVIALAEANGLGVIPHMGGLTAVGLAADLQLAAAMNSCSMLEYDLSPYQPLRDDILVVPVFSIDRVVDGYLQVPPSPGLGIEIDESKLEGYPYRYDIVYPDKYASYGAGEL